MSQTQELLLSCPEIENGNTAFKNLILQEKRDMLNTFVKRKLPTYFFPGSHDYLLCRALVDEWNNKPCKDVSEQAKLLRKYRDKAQDWQRVNNFMCEFWDREEQQQRMLRKDYKHSTILCEQPTQGIKTHSPSRFLHCRNLHTKESKAHNIREIINFLKVVKQSSVKEISDLSGLDRSTVNGYIRELEAMGIVRREKGTICLVVENPIILDGTQVVGFHHILGNLAEESRVHGTPHLIPKICEQIKENSPFFLNHPARDIYQHPKRNFPTMSTSFFMKCSDDQIPDTVFCEFWDELEGYFGKFYISDFDVALDIHGTIIRERFSSIAWEREDVKRIIRMYIKGKDVQRLEVANLDVIIDNPKDALILTQIFNSKTDLAIDKITLKRKVRLLEQEIAELEEENLKIKTQLDVLGSKPLMGAFRKL